MKQWWQTVAKDYFAFSKKEGIAILFIAIIALCLWLFAHYLPSQNSVPKGKETFQNELANLQITVDSSRKFYKKREFDNADYAQPKRSYNNDYANASKDVVKGELFEFDPNTIGADGWKRLGVKDKTIHTIQNFVGKGYRFRQPEDIKKIYGLRPADADRLVPYIRIKESNTEVKAPVNAYVSKPPVYTNTYKPTIIDINIADTSAYISLPGIGSKLAGRIINFRDKLGGFVSVDQVGETYGLPDSTFQKIKPRLQFTAISVRKVNINTADINELKSHPYIRWNIGNAIINYKQQHGNFTSVADLLKINIITEEMYNKMMPYLTL